MFGVLSADVACKQDNAAQTPRSLFQGCCTAGPCDRGVGLDMDLASFSRERGKFLEYRLCIAELEAGRPSQLKIVRLLSTADGVSATASEMRRPAA